MTTYRQDIDFHGLFRKLAHNLEEIRVRALENIISKLDHKLICEQDVVHERHLFIRLLEWFNQKPCSRKEDVLKLLLRLSQHWAAAELLQGIGGVEFLTQLRSDIEMNLQPIVDQILENIMRLPEVKSQEHAPDCIYHKSTDNSVWGATISSVEDGRSHSRISVATSAGTQVNSLPPEVVHRAGFLAMDPQSYFETGHDATQMQSQTEMKSEQGFKMSTFPWLPLTPTDRHVLLSTNKSLQSKEVSQLVSACEFLSDVVFQDFPAEIFLQRPQIFKSLLSLLGVGPSCEPACTVSVAHTLSDLCHGLQVRIRYYQDPSLYTAKQDFSSTSPTSSSSSLSVHSSDTRPSLVGWSDRRHRGDGRDGDSSESASSVADVPVQLSQEPYLEDMDSLQYTQLSVACFSLTVLLQALESLHTTHQAVATELVILAFESWKILAVVLPKEVWSAATESARDLMDKFRECLNKIASLLEYHHHNFQSTSKDATEFPKQKDVKQHRVVFLSVANILSHLLYLLPQDKVNDVIPERLQNSMGILLFDESFAVGYPHCHARLSHFAQVLNLESYCQYVMATHIRQSMLDMCRFMLQTELQTFSVSEAATLADSALVSLPYHKHLSFVRRFIAFISYVCSRKSSDKITVGQCTGTLLKIMSHPLPEFRQYTYQSLLESVQASLNASEAADVKFKGHLEVKFLINSDVLYEVACFGLADADNKVSSLAMELLFHLLQSSLLLGDILWSELMTRLQKSFPIVQSYTDLNTRLGRRIWMMLDPTVASDSLSLLDKLRGNLRLMLHQDSGLRTEAAKRVSWFLAHESDNSSHKPPPVASHLDFSQMSNIFMVDSPNYLDNDMGRSVFQVEGMKQVYAIFTADPVDPGVKKSAADQLAIMLQDPHLHAAFRQSGGFEAILGLLHSVVAQTSRVEFQANSNVPCVLACLTMLRHILYYDCTLRHNLSVDSSVYYDLIRVSFIMVRDKNVSYQVSHILTQLLFDEVAKFDISCSQGGQIDKNFSLPAIISKRYRLPFRMSVHHTVSPNAVLPASQDDVYKTPLIQEMLRVAWNIAWCGGLDEMLQMLKSGANVGELKEFSSVMVLTPVDKMIAFATGLNWGLKEGVFAVANAVSHTSVTSALRQILSYLTITPSTQSADLLHKMNWTSVLNRFLSVPPNSPQDESLLLEVMVFISTILKVSGQIPEEILQWLAEHLYQSTGSVMTLLNRSPFGGDGEDSSDTSTSANRSLDKVLLQFIGTFISCLPYSQHKRLKISQMPGDLARKLLLRLNITAAPHFYNLAALERTLLCLMHLTARPGWSAKCTDLDSASLCSQVLNCLLEVVSAFHVGRGGSAMSYMGKGVTKTATLCLRHLAYEMVTATQDKEWARNWLFSRQGADAVAEPGLNWMLTLWAYRDPEVRAAGLGTAVALTSSETGRLMVTANCKHIPGGIWGAAFSILLDHSECSIVRQQAALLLVNLTSQPIPSSSVDLSTASSNMWQGPVVTDTESDITLVGLNALLALLHHSKFYQQLVIMLEAFFPANLLQPILITSDIPLYSLDSSQTTVTTAG